MPPRVTVEEDFDDDTDLPLPAHPYLPDTGTRGAVLQELMDDPIPSPSYASSKPAAEGAAQTSQSAAANDPKDNRVTDVTPYKTWTSIYPIYMDAKRSYGPERRIARGKSVWWPTSTDIQRAATAIGLRSLHEMQKTHPRDWDNPGRVRVLWKQDGRLVFTKAKTRKQLIEMLSVAIQAAKPELKPSSSNETRDAQVPPQPSKSSGSYKSKSVKTRRGKRQGGENRPPKHKPPLATRLSPYSPAVESGVLIETVKSGMNANAPNSAIEGGGGMPGGSSKGKRKVVRVRA